MLQQFLDHIRHLNMAHLTLEEAYDALDEGKVTVPSEISQADVRRLCNWLGNFVNNPEFHSCLSANVMAFVEGRKNIFDSGEHRRIRPIDPEKVLVVASEMGNDHY